MKHTRWTIALCASALLLAAPAVRAQDAEPARRPRICAEWEPALGTLVTWPHQIPQALVVELASDDRLFVLVADEAARRDAATAYAEWGVELDHVEFIETSVQTCWTRDYGPHQVFDAEGRLSMVDPIYIDTPLMRADFDGDRAERPMTYFGRYPGDDASSADVARHLELPLVPMEAYLTGGNFLVDGLGNAFATRALVDENLRILEEDAFLGMVEELTGVDRLIELDGTEDWGIQHIDCWFKLVDPETILVKRAPESHPEHARIERNVERLRELESPFGTPYRIVRIDCPAFRGNRIAAYTNSLILNDKVCVPLFGIEADEAALETFREVLPGYEVLGFPYGGWREFDALHCRTRAVFDPQMLRIAAPRPREPWPAGEEPELAVWVRDESGAGFAEGSPSVDWRRVGAEGWERSPLAPAGEPDRYAARLPAQEAGTELEFRFVARSASGREASWPAGGSAAAARLRIEDPAAREEPAEPGEPAEPEER